MGRSRKVTRRVGRKKITEMRRNRSRRRSRRNRQNPRRTNHKRNPRSIKRTTNGKRVKKRRKRSRKIEGGDGWDPDPNVRQTQVKRGDILINNKTDGKFMVDRWCHDSARCPGEYTYLWVRDLNSPQEANIPKIAHYTLFSPP